MWQGLIICTTRIACIVLCVLSGGHGYAQFGDAAGAAAESWRVDTDHFRLPAGRPIGSTAGIAIDADGRSVWVFDRCGGNSCIGSDLAPIMKFDASGSFIRSFGAGMFVRPHGISVDRDGNVWVADGEGDGGKGHQVFKLAPDGSVLMTLGTAGVAGDAPGQFNQPSAVAVAPNGNVFVADGHGRDSNARIVKFANDGEFISAWGRRGEAPGEFNTPHALAFDSRGRLFVGDRGNFRIQIFDQDGNFLDAWTQFGNPSGLYIDDNDVIYVTEIGPNPEQGPDWQEGLRIGSAVDGSVTAFMAESARSSQEGVTADAFGNVYTSYTAGMKLRRYGRP
jgi:DNA-binding beta-propeller fold protein YncE